MKYIIVLINCCLFSYSSFAGKISGTVTDTEGKALPFASVYVKETNKGTNANSEGAYTLFLPPGIYTIICQHVGYSRSEKQIDVKEAAIILNFQLAIRELTLSEVIIKKGEDPAYEIIRNAIKKRTYYQQQLDTFQCQVYTKGQLRLRDYPKKIFDKKVDFEDGDTSKQKMLYLSETVALYSVERPNKEKIEVISSKVSGQSDGFGLSAPRFFSFYNNNITIGTNLNPRGFISPIADKALIYYKYKLVGSDLEDGREINHIKVTARRKFEPLFNGYIDIVADDWRIHSVQMQLTKESQMELIDTLRIEQLYRPVNNEVWFVSSQVIYPAVKFFGFDAFGSFINIYSDINCNPGFSKKHFNNIILEYTDSANKKTKEYWDNTRPLPLMIDEKADYKKKDSLEIVRKNPHYTDSLDKVRNKISLPALLVTGQSFSSTKKRSSVSINPLIGQLFFNPAEGWLINTSISWQKKLDTIPSSRKNITVTPVFRYGFANNHINSYLTLNYTSGKKYASNFYFSGGKRVFQFNNNSPIGERGNSISCLISEENRIKSYEAWYLRGSYRQELGNGFSWVAAFQFQARSPLENRTDYTWRDKTDRAYTPNYPNDLVTQNIEKHQVFTTLLGIRWQPGTWYIKLPDRKINIGSTYPVFTLQYTRACEGLFGTDADFSKWKFTMKDDLNLKLRGLLRYRIGLGGFINRQQVPIPDYDHFNGNISTLATEYLNSFQLLPIYQFSNTAHFYSLAHVEYNLKGFLTNKIPLVKKLNFYLVMGANGFYIEGNRNYYEWFVGIDNIFKQVRVDFVQSYQQGKPWQNGLRIGLSKLGGRRGDDWP